MSSEPAVDRLQSEFEDQLSDALTALCRLSTDDIAQVRNAMQAAKLPFGDAAVSVGLVTQKELDAAMHWVKNDPAWRSSGVVETAVRRQGGRSRSLTVRHSEVVRPGPQLILAHEPHNPRSERVRALRTELLLLNESARSGRALALVSPGRGEGRSQLCAELALAYAQLGRPTLLVDADLRNPRQHILFGAENNLGLAQALAFGEAPRMLGVEGFPQLTLLTSGPVGSNPAELLSAEWLRRIVSDWQRKYEFVIVDTPPVGVYADALAIATLTESVLVLGRARHTSHQQMKEMLRRLGNTQTRVMGAVLSSF